MICTFVVATASFIVMFYYSVTFSRYTALGVNYITEFKRKNLSADINLPDLIFGAFKESLNSTEKTQPKNSAQSTLSSNEEESTKETGQQNTQDSKEAISSSNQVTVFQPTETEKGTSTSTTSVAIFIPTKKVGSNNNSDQELSLCPEKSPTLVGALYVDSQVPKIEDVEKDMSKDFKGWVDHGGHSKPTKCKARKKLALIIPYRNRFEQLKIFVRQMHPILRRQNLDYRIMVIEQGGTTLFNRAMLFNIGYKEALKFDDFECFIFHDVDLIPEDDRNDYSCPTSPRHLSVAIDKFDYRLPYSTIFGGAGAFSREHFELINGFSNQFWGWGGEDDDLYSRIAAKQLKLTRPSMQVGRYKMLKIFHTSGKADPDRFAKLKDSAQRMASDGINSLLYKVENVTEHRLYTQVTVDVREAMPKKLQN